MEIQFNNKTSFIPYNRTNEPYTNVLNSVLEDDRLTLLAIGIYTYILKFKNFFYDGKRYIIIKEVIEKRSGFGYDSFTKHWNILVKCGYINARRIKSGWEYEFIEKPIKNTSNVNRSAAPTYGILTNSKKTNCQNATIESKVYKKQIQVESLESRVLEVPFKTDTIAVEATAGISTIDRIPDKISYNVLSRDIDIDFSLESNIDFGNDF